MSVPRVTAAVAAALVALTAGVAPATATTDPLDQEVGADERTVAERTVVDAGHVDLGPRFVAGQWRLQARDDRTVPAVWRSLDDTVLHLTDAAVLPAPEGEEWRFLGVAPGDPVHVVPQTEAPGVPWLGWNTQDPEVTRRIGAGATLTLTGVSGPGALLLFLQEGVAEPPDVLWDSREPTPQQLFMETNTHTHANWVFTAPGAYEVAVQVSADLQDGSRAVDGAVLRFAVGSEVDPASLFPSGDDRGAGPAGGGDTAGAADDPAAAGAAGEGASGVPPWLLGVGLVGLVAVGGAVAVAAGVARRRRAAAWAAARREPGDAP